MGTEHQIAFFLRELSAPDPARRAAVAKGLGRLGRAEHAQALVGAARDPEPVVRAAAALGLGRLARLGVPGVPVADDVLICLMGDTDPQVRRRASVAAERLALTGPAITEAYGRLLRDEDWHVRLNGLVGLISLGATGDPTALMPLLGDPEPGIWGRARVQVWQRMNDDAMLAEVIRTAREGPGASRAKALEMLPAEYTAQLRDSLLTGLRDQAPEVRRAVGTRLIRDPAPGKADALLAALEDERDPRVARTLLSALDSLGEPRALTLAVRWLDHPDVGASAVEALAAIGTRTAVRHIRSALVHGPRHVYVWAAAARTLGEFGDRHAVDLLLPLIHDPDKRIRVGALDGLCVLGDHRLPRRERRRVTEALLDHLLADPEVLWDTQYALRGYPEALPRLRHVADDMPGEVRAVALSLLDETDGDRFLAHLDDPHEPVRYRAALGYGRYVQKYGVPPQDRAKPVALLTALTADASQRTCRAAAEVLSALTDKADA